MIDVFKSYGKILVWFQQEGGEPLASGRERRAMGRDRWGDIYASVPVKVMIALYDYDPQELSPNVDSEVSSHLPCTSPHLLPIISESDFGKE